MTAEAKAHYDRLLGDIVRELKIVPKPYGEQDDRPRWSVSLITDVWMGTGPTPEVRRAKFLKMMAAYPYAKFPLGGTDIYASHLIKDGNFTRLKIRASPEWHEAALRHPSVGTPLGDLLLKPILPREEETTGGEGGGGADKDADPMTGDGGDDKKADPAPSG